MRLEHVSLIGLRVRLVGHCIVRHPRAHIEGVADIALRQGDSDVTESFGHAPDCGERWLAGTGSRYRVRLVRGEDKPAGEANGQESAEVRRRRAFIGFLQ